MSELDLFAAPAPSHAPTIVVNISGGEPFDIYIGRAMPSKGLEASKWGNPFKIAKEADRGKAVAQYEPWLRNQPALMVQLRELKGKRIGCWCHPKPCHGHILARLADALPDRAIDRLEFHLRNRQSFRWIDGPGSRERRPDEWLAWLQHLGHIPQERKDWRDVTEADALAVLQELERLEQWVAQIRGESRRAS